MRDKYTTGSRHVVHAKLITSLSKLMRCTVMFYLFQAYKNVFVDTGQVDSYREGESSVTIELRVMGKSVRAN